MDARMQNYAGIMVDASLFARPFPDELQQLLAHVPVYVAETWTHHVAVMEADLREPQKTYFADNMAVLSRNKPVIPGDIGYTGDVVGMVLALAQQWAARGKRYLFVTADQMLLQRLVLERVWIDIYDLWNRTILLAESFTKIGRAFEFALQQPQLVPTADTTQSTLELYGEDGTLFRLNSTTKGGSEAKMYTCDARPGHLAKIYKKTQSRVILDQYKIENISNLQTKLSADPSCSWALVPLEKLYLEPECRNVVGFFMKKAGAETLFSELDVLNDEKSNIQVRDNIQLCTKLIRQLSYLSVYGFSVYDYNPANFACSSDHPDSILMMDADSFCSGNYFTTFQASDLCVRKKFEPGVTNKAESIRICTELSYIYAGYLLRRKINPLLNNGQLRDEDEAIWRRVPKNICRLFQMVFNGNMPYFPQFDALLHELKKADKMLEGKDIPYNSTDVLSQLEPAEEPKAQAETSGPRQTREEPDTAPEEDPTGTVDSETESADQKRQWEVPGEEQEEPEEEPDAGAGYADAFDSFEVDDRVFLPTNRMRIKQAPPAEGPKHTVKKKQFYFAPAPLRNLYASDAKNENEQKDAQRWLRTKKLMKIAAVCLATIFIGWLLFGADPDWIYELRGAVSQVVQWLRDLEDVVTQTLTEWIQTFIESRINSMDQ